MMYIHYCQSCCRIHILNGHKSVCPTCDQKLTELRLTYLEYIEMDREQRRLLQVKLANPKDLALHQVP
ncbi:MAG: hypothetical protein IJZ84_01060 [Lachnospiraceae bacterium]|nr:hypothetical protein [Lachnospiraceae bacterium]